MHSLQMLPRCDGIHTFINYLYGYFEKKTVELLSYIGRFFVKVVLVSQTHQSLNLKEIKEAFFIYLVANNA